MTKSKVAPFYLGHGVCYFRYSACIVFALQARTGIKQFGFCVLQVIIPRKHLLLTDMMAELERTLRPPVANYVFLNTYFFTETKPDPNISNEFTIARLRHRASIFVRRSMNHTFFAV